VAAGVALKIMDIEEYMTNISQHFEILFLVVLLPPIIFEAGYNLDKDSFMKNLGTVIMFAFVGTFIAIFTSSFLFYAIGQTSMSPEFTWKESFAFGSLISATDPVSVLAVFKSMDADVNLFAIVFGESIFNDAIALVMFDTVMMVGEDGKSAGNEILSAIGSFFLIFTGSLVIGAVSALLIAFVLKRQNSHALEAAAVRKEQEEELIQN
jgi:NhaP-type Na+/H+ or K+/H+ antiporter